jgi:large subunit ribosomal protein L21
VIVVEKLAGEAGDASAFDQVFLMSDGAAVTVGSPIVAGAAVTGEVVEQRRGDKKLVVKKTRRSTYRRRRGHRQHETVVRITSVTADGAKAAAAAAAKPAKKSAKAASGGDDLKLIGGVGPAIEKKLSALGVTTFAQIAAMSDAELAKLDEDIGFKGRAVREDWVGQARDLMAGKPPRAKADQEAAKAAQKSKTGES